MWSRFGLVLLWALASFPADTSQTLRERYGLPIFDPHGTRGSETFAVRSTVVASVRYGKSGYVCDILIRPSNAAYPLNRRSNSINSKLMSEILDELVPRERRGERRTSGPLHIACGSDHPDLDCGGAEFDWEKLVIHRNGGGESEQCASVRWKRDECHFVSHADIGCALEDPSY